VALSVEDEDVPHLQLFRNLRYDLVTGLRSLSPSVSIDQCDGRDNTTMLLYCLWLPRIDYLPFQARWCGLRLTALAITKSLIPPLALYEIRRSSIQGRGVLGPNSINRDRCCTVPLRLSPIWLANASRSRHPTKAFLFSSARRVSPRKLFLWPCTKASSRNVKALCCDHSPVCEGRPYLPGSIAFPPSVSCVSSSSPRRSFVFRGSKERSTRELCV